MVNPSNRVRDLQTPADAQEISFVVDGHVTEVLRGCGVATIHSGLSEEYSVNRGTDGVHFETLRVGQKVSCQVALPTQRVVHVQQQTQPTMYPHDAARPGLTDA